MSRLRLAACGDVVIGYAGPSRARRRSAPAALSTWRLTLLLSQPKFQYFIRAAESLVKWQPVNAHFHAVLSSQEERESLEGMYTRPEGLVWHHGEWRHRRSKGGGRGILLAAPSPHSCLAPLRACGGGGRRRRWGRGHAVGPARRGRGWAAQSRAFLTPAV